MTVQLRRPIYAPSLKALTESIRQRFGDAVSVALANASSMRIDADSESTRTAAASFIEGFFAGRNSRS